MVVAKLCIGRRSDELLGCVMLKGMNSEIMNKYSVMDSAKDGEK